MKLKSIMGGLMYGECKGDLVRSEGARRVRQAEKMLELRNKRRNMVKVLNFVNHYGDRTKLQQTQNTKFLRC